MSQSSIAIAVAVLAVLASAAGIAFNATSNPYDVRLAQLEESLKDVSAPTDALDVGFKADFNQWKTTVDSRAAVWDSLVPPPPPKVAKPDPGKEMEGIKLLPGSSGKGENARVRLSSPGNERGRMFKVGEAVTPNVSIKDVTPDKINFDVKVGGQILPYSMPR